MNAMLNVGMNPCAEIPLTSRDTARELFTSCINYMHNEGISLYGVIHENGYTLENLRSLIMRLYDVEDFFGEFSAKNDTQLGMATRVFGHLKRSFENKELTPGRTGEKFSIDYGREGDSEKMLIEVLSMPIERVPLFINGTILEKELALWRIKMGK